jgi:hypothetical protein
MGALWISCIGSHLAARVMGVGMSSGSVVAESPADIWRFSQGLHCAKHRFPHLCNGPRMACLRYLAREELAVGAVARHSSCALSYLSRVRGDEPSRYWGCSFSRRPTGLAAIWVERSDDRDHCWSRSRCRIMGELTESERIRRSVHPPNPSLRRDQRG